MKTAIVLFRQDLRISDNPALAYATKNADRIIPIYVLDDETPGKWKPGGASRWWLHHSLQSLEKNLRERLNLSLTLFRGNTRETILKAIDVEKATLCCWNRCYEPYALKLENELKEGLGERGSDFKTFNGSLLIEPWEIYTKQGTHYKVFTQFWRQAVKMIETTSPFQAKKQTQLAHSKMKSDKLNDWELLPNHPNWAKGFEQLWVPGERGAQDSLSSFLSDHAKGYDILRDYPGTRGTSLLSPRLHFGELSPMQVWRRCQKLKLESADDQVLKHNIESYVREIGWREFSYYLLYHCPSLPEKPFVEKFNSFKWNRSISMLRAWQKGMTGYPIVDAGMRELWATGWMHNRVRMIVASFLTKDLLIHWKRGEEWFWDTLVDADLASNSASWQWVAGSGADAAPYFRIFNPVTQGEKFDADGEYVRRWVPEIKNLPNRFLQAPWNAPEDVLRKAGITLGVDYPHPVVDHAEARLEALKRFKDLSKLID